MPTAFLILISTFFLSLGAVMGAVTLLLSKKHLQKMLMVLVGLSAGTLLGGAFLHLLPESFENMEVHQAMLITLVSIVLFFVVEKFLHWRHCHRADCDVHTIGQMNLIGDAIHNFMDGLIIAAAYVIDVNLGIATTVAVAFHEIPQELGDFGVLLHAGWQPKRALIANFLVAMTIVFGGLFGYFLSEQSVALVPYLLPIAAGSFIYIAASDLIPEIRQERSMRRSLGSIMMFIVGVGIMLTLAH